MLKCSNLDNWITYINLSAQMRSASVLHNVREVRHDSTLSTSTEPQLYEYGNSKLHSLYAVGF